MIIATSNLNWALSWSRHRAMIIALLGVADVLCLQELRTALRLAMPWRVWVTQRGNGGEAVAVRRGARVRTVFRGNWLASPSNFGQRIRARRFPWRVVETSHGLVMIVSVHMPPARMNRSQIDEAYAERLHALIRYAIRHGWEWVVSGDFNEHRSSDPADLRTTFGARLYGTHIDFHAVSPGLVPHVVRSWYDPPRADRHRNIYLELED